MTKHMQWLLRLARACIEGMAAELAPQDPGYAPTRARYLARFPDATFNFHLADFSFFRIVPSRARYVAGFGRIFDLSVAELTESEAAPR